MIRKRSGTTGAIVLVLFGVQLALPADAQETFPPPPVRPFVDENGVDLASGELQLAPTDIVVGQPGAGGLSFGRIFKDGYYWTHSYTGRVDQAQDGSNYTATVFLGNYAESFQKPTTPANSPWGSVQGRGSTLTDDSTTWTYTAADGAVAVYAKYLPGSSTFNWVHPTSLTLPDGEIRTYNYVTATLCGNASCSVSTPGLRLQSVTNNRGYQIKLIYSASGVNTNIPVAQAGLWTVLAGAMGVNMAKDWCDPLANGCSGSTQTWPAVTYNEGVSGLVITDQLGGSTSYTQWGPSAPLSIRWPGSQIDNVVYTFYNWPFRVTSVNRNGRTWTYSYTASGDPTMIVTDPQNRQSSYVFDATTRSIKNYTSTAGEVTTYQNDSNGRPSVVTLPTGETVRYQYDARGNITEVRRTSFPAGSPDLVVTTASYDSTCTTSTAKKCNKPNWTRDAAGNQTDYVYSTAHGNPTSITLPDVGGIRPATTYTYTAYQAYYKNSAGAIVAAGTNVYYLTSVAQCRTTSGCSASSSDQLRTEIGYGANNVANNRLPVQTTVRNGSGTLIATTALTYDDFGNLVAADGPLTGTVDKTATRYDALRRVIGTVSPDPDGTGPRLNIGVRTSYDARGLPYLVETGTLPGQTESAWGSFVPAQALAREFDADWRVSKISVLAGGSTYSVEQLSFDTLGRVDCTATRMNPAYFTALPTSACTATADGPFGPDRIVKYGYDGADRVTSVTSGFGQPDAIVQQSLTYRPGGRLDTLTDGKGNKTTYDYDGYGRLFRTYYPHPTNVGQSSTTDYEELAYDAGSRLTWLRKRSGDVIQTPRDNLGRVTVEDVPGSAEDVSFTYDNQGRVLSANFNNGTGITQAYDGLGRLASRTVFGRAMSYQYDLAGRRTRLTYPGGFYVNYAYTNVDELSSLTDSAGAVVASFGYDALGARTSVSRPNGAATSYVPDALERLQSLTQDLSGTSYDLTASYAYNPAGQIASRTSSNDAAYTPVPSPGTTAAQFDGQNQLTSFAAAAVTDDANANVRTGVNSLTYTYDARGWLRQGSGGASSALVDYDPAGMLRRVTVGSTVTEFLYDGADLIAEYSGSGTLLRRFVHGAGSDEPLVAYEGSGTTNKSWLHADERGSILAASNGSGAASASVKYTADGDSGALASPFGYTGQLYLPELQLYYYKARMYSAKAGRFLQPDPIGYGGSMNVYGYVGADPINSRDPSGLDKIDDPGCAGCGTYFIVANPPADSGSAWLAPGHAEALLDVGVRSQGDTSYLDRTLVAGRGVATGVFTSLFAVIAATPEQEMFERFGAEIYDDPVLAGDFQSGFNTGYVIGIFGMVAGARTGGGGSGSAVTGVVRASELLRPGGQLIGTAGSRNSIRELQGGAAQAEKLFQQLSAGGRVVTRPGHPRTLVELPGGGFVGYRPVSASGPPTIDVNIPGFADITKIKFVP